MSDIDKMMNMLHPLERKILPLLETCHTLSSLVELSHLQEAEVMRALEWLEHKQIVTTTKKNEQSVVLGKNGEKYRAEGLPEKRVLRVLKKTATLAEIQNEAKLSAEEVNAAMGILRRLGTISIVKTEKGLTLTKVKNVDFEEEKFLQQQFPITHELAMNNKSFQQLLSRKDILLIKEDKDKSVELTPLGKKLVAKGISQEEMIGRITPKILQFGEWKNKKFRPYDVEAGVARLHAGKKHMVTQAVEYIKKIWLELGFQEMNGRMIETAFWDLDSLFVPQDHPAREMQDTFYVQSPGGELPPLARKIKDVHEHGGKTGSTGWGGQWSEKEAQQLLLRTHTTVLSAQTLAQLKETDLPAKFFAVGKVFRNEALNWKHLFEFYQVEGIVVDPNANLSHLKWYLKEFYKKMGYPDVRIRPAHFPYTEPSCEVEVYHPVKKEWVELGGAGIFRSEVVIPLLGKDIPVLAWGLGLDRVISQYYGLSDIRDLYKNDLKLLRDAELWVK